MIKIIAGKHQGRIIKSVKFANYRPSTSRVRESIFNILSSLELKGHFTFAGAHVLDLFAGTGSLGFEALSRGAETVTFVDHEAKYLNAAKEFAKTIKQEENCYFWCMDALSLTLNSNNFDLILMDPPYYQMFANKIIEQMLAKNLLKSKSLIVVELAKTDNLLINKAYMNEIITRVYSNTKFIVLQVI